MDANDGPQAAERKAMFDGQDELRAVMGSNNGHMQAAYLIMAVRAVGLAAGPMGVLDAAGIDTEFHAGQARRTFIVVNIGKPAENAWYPRLPRLDYDSPRLPSSFRRSGQTTTAAASRCPVEDT